MSPTLRAPRLWIERGAWQLAGIHEMERAGWDVLRSDDNHLVVAGPGAGKTELLAQRAAYLLQTNVATFPRRVLAVSFKKDAARILGERVQARCGDELAARFESYTFDAFAKSLVERFRKGLPENIRPPSFFDIAADNDLRKLVNDRVRTAIRELRATTSAQLPSGHHGVEGNRDFISTVLAGDALDRPGTGTRRTFQRSEVLAWATGFVWSKLLATTPCVLTFPMVLRMAQRVAIENPRVSTALRLTYSHVFLDEFQDVTALQYELLSACFPPSHAHRSSGTLKTVLTAVGDDKQRIMIWAGALRDAFDRFERDYRASQTTLLMNYRSDSVLVDIQRTLISSLNNHCPAPTPASNNCLGTGKCEILSFSSDDAEADHLAERIASLLAGEETPYEAIGPRRMCILSRILVDNYTNRIRTALANRGIRSRVEDRYQDLLKDDALGALLRVLRLVTKLGGRDDYVRTRDLVFELDGVWEGDEARTSLIEETLGKNLAVLGEACTNSPNSHRDVYDVIVSILNNVFGGSSRLRQAFPHLQNETTYRRTMREFTSLLNEARGRVSSWGEIVLDFMGNGAIPIMTVHKSKGLEYHTVFFIGLEDHAWARFSELSEEERCVFFVGFSRAEQQVIFTYCQHRMNPTGERVPQGNERVAALYDMLRAAGVEVQQV